MDSLDSCRAYDTSMKHAPGKRFADTARNQDDLLATTKTDTATTPKPDTWPPSLLAVFDNAWIGSLPVQILLLDLSADSPIPGLEGDQTTLTIR